MLDTMSLLLIIIFFVLLVANFACQIYVSTRVFKERGDFQIVMGILRGNRTFIRGWQRAKELDIKDIMLFWSIVLVSLLVVLCSVGGIFVASGSPSASKHPGDVPAVQIQKSQDNQPQSAPGSMMKIFVALRPIKKGSQFGEGPYSSPSAVNDQRTWFIGYLDWPIDSVPPDTIASKEETIGRVAAVDIEPGQPILRSMLIEQ